MDLDQKIRFLSDITGLEAEYSFTPELDDFYAPYLFSLDLGGLYTIEMPIKISNDSGKVLGYDMNWLVSYRGETIAENIKYHSALLHDGPITLDEGLKKIVETTIGTLDLEINSVRMDYENFNLMDLQGSIYNNPYMTLMTHMKEMGIPMPPIQSKYPNIRARMELGQIDILKKALQAMQMLSSSDERCLSHMCYEAEAILEYAEKRAIVLNPHLPIEQKFKNLKLDIVEGSPEKNYTFLVIDGEPEGYGTSISGHIRKLLSYTDEFGGSKVIRSSMMKECLEYVMSGQIDYVIIDSSKVRPSEIFMINRGDPMSGGTSYRLDEDLTPIYQHGGKTFTRQELLDNTNYDMQVSVDMITRLNESAASVNKRLPTYFIYLGENKELIEFLYSI